MPTDPLEAALEKLADGVDKLNATMEKAGRAASPTGANTQQATTGSAIQRWAGDFNQRAGFSLGSYAGNKVRQWGGGEAMKLAGEAFGGSKVGKWFKAKMGRGGPPPQGGSSAGATGRAATAGEAAGAGRVAAVAGPAGVAFAVVTATVIALKQFHDQLVATAKTQQSLNFRYAEFSSSMAIVKARSDVADIFRSQRIGNATSGAAGELARANTKYDDQAARLEIIGSNLKNQVVAKLLDGVAEVAKPAIDYLENVMKGIEKLVQKVDKDFKFGGKPEEQKGIQEWAESQRKFLEEERERNRQRWFGRKPF